MSKQSILITAPVTSRSGYGSHSRDIVKSLIFEENYQLFIRDVRWGDCPRNALTENSRDELNTHILSRMIPHVKLDRKPDIHIDIRIPNEFELLGNFNIGVTAGIETNAVSPKWLECCNKMDLIITTSKHSKTGFINSKYDQLQKLPDGTQQKIGELKLEKPIETLFEGADIDIFKKTKEIPDEINKTLNDIKEDFCFLFVGQWVKGGFGEDRKDIGKMLKIFYEAFANKSNQPALILKTNGASLSIQELKTEALIGKLV